MEDKIIASKGYCMLVMDEGVEFFQRYSEKTEESRERPLHAEPTV